jgi:hypothetical protein
VAPGQHKLRAVKPGYQEASAQPVVVAGSDTQVPVSMLPESHTGHVSVHEKNGRTISVYIDGVERGSTPWQGEVEAGQHEIYGRGDGRVTAARPLPVAKGATTEVELVSAPQTARLTIAIDDRKATVTIDGQVVGEGPYDGDVPAGPHVVRVARDGYEQFEKHIVLVEGHPHSETVTLPPVTVIRTGAAGASEPMSGAFGGLLGAFVFEPGGLNGDISSPCAPSIASCSGSTPIGAGLLGYAGYMSKPVGLDVLFGVQADTSSSTVTAMAGGSPVTLGVPRAGGLVALRARLAWQAPEVRLTFAGGVGMAVRAVRLAPDGDFFSLFSGGTQELVYVAPAITLEGAMHWRTSPGTGISLGILFWAENAGSGPELQAPNVLPQPVHVLAGTQAFVLPFLGLEFGP